MKKVLFLLLSFAFSLSLYAEGSKDLYPQGGLGYRAFLMARGNTKASQPFDPFPSYGVHKVYAKAGEFIYTGSSNVGKGNGTSTGGIRIFNSAGTEVASSFALGTTTGLIQNRSQELNGPNRIGVSNGYTPLKYSVPSDGIYEVQFISFTPESINDNGTNFPSTHSRANLSVGSNWNQTPISDANSNSLIAAWDVTVINASETASIPGRVYTRVVNLTTFNGEFSIPAFYGKFYVLTPQGYTYLVDNNGQNGASFNFFSNNKGIMPTDNVFTGTPSYASFNSSTDISKRYWDPRRKDNHGVVSNKIFYNQPDLASFPDSASVGYSAYGSSANNNLINAMPNSKTWLKGQLVVPELSNVVVTCGGVITFESNINGNYQILIDGNNDDKYDHSSDVILNGVSTKGVNSITVSSSVLSNITAAVGSVGAELRLRITTAEIHIPFVDVEANTNGINITRLGGGADASLVFWNNSGLDALSNQKTSNPIRNLEGVSSLVNGHIWGSTSTTPNVQNTQVSNFGDNRTLDTWAFVFDEVSTNIRVSNCLNLSGNVWNDINENGVKNATESFISGTTVNGVNSSVPTISTTQKLFVYIVNAEGIVTARVPVKSDGTYTTDKLTSNTSNLKLYLTNDSFAIGAEYIQNDLVGTWEHVSSNRANNANVSSSGMISLPQTSSALTNYNFGISNIPQSGSGVVNDLDPGGTSQVVVKPSAFNNTNTPSSSNSTVRELLITSFPLNATSLVVNGTTYTTIPNGGIRIPVDANGNPTVAVSVDPSFSGRNKVEIKYNTVDALGVVSKDTGSAVVKFPASVTVNLWNDWNGNLGKSNTEKKIVAASTNFNANTEMQLTEQLYAYLVDATTNVVLQVGVLTANGTYEFPNIYDDNNFKIVLSTQTATLGQVVSNSTYPQKWTTTGVDNQGTKVTATFTGVIPIGVLSNNINNIHIGLQQPPMAASSQYELVGNIVENAIIPLNATRAATSGTLGFLPVFDAESKSTLTLKIQQTPYVLNNGLKVPNTSVLMYNGVEVNQTNFPNLEIPNFDSTKLSIQVKGSGITNVNFDFTVIDAAGTSSALASYGFEWITPLPLEFLLFEAKLSNNKVNLEWHTTAERNTKGFDIERAAEGAHWQKIGFVKSNNAFDLINKYNFVDQEPINGVNQYRIKQIDQDGQFAYSTIRLVTLAADMNIALTPNPTTDALFINNVSAFSSMLIFNASGAKVATVNIEGNSVRLDVRSYTSGMYKIVFVDKSGTTHQASFIKK